MIDVPTVPSPRIRPAMFRCFSLGLLLSFAIAARAAEDPPGYRPLFDGQSLNGDKKSPEDYDFKYWILLMKSLGHFASGA